MLRLALPCLLLSCAASSTSSAPALSRPFDPNCMDDYGRDHCDRGQRDAIERSFRVPRAEALAEQGWEGLRVFMVDGYSHDVPLITVLHRQGAQPRLEVRGVSPTARTLEAPAGSELEAAARKLLALAAASPVVPSTPATEGGEALSICLHAWVSYVEAIEHGQITRRIRNACQEDAVFEQSFALSTLVIARFSPCGLLRPEDYRNDHERLEDCLELKGEDLQAAAQVHNGFMSLRAQDAETLRAALAPDAVLTRPEGPPLNGADAIVAWLSAENARHDVVYLLSKGVIAGPNTADHEGTLEVFKQGKGTRARFTQRWVRGSDGTWRITRWELQPAVSTREKTD